MALISLLYISRSTLDRRNEAVEVESILATAHAHNATANITGTLVSTHEHFAQVLEGSTDAVDRLMGRIFRDKRHEHIEIVQRADVTQRSFSEWAMAYSGPLTYVAAQVSILIDRPPNTWRDGHAADRLINVMQEFAR